ncbi:kelch repeat and BTB domain-containing protein 13 [Gadus morhua]|uniref:kelch repeat and BTB domain-containing protein 13 n=1 Tax=Gadus morhua TaxID=8049 RepID=UPI0011B5D013|nr:kelch repeat and BTB domain-containing protein 13-like [Gadus morhua]
MEARGSLGLAGFPPAQDGGPAPGDGDDQPAGSLRVRVEDCWIAADRALLARHSDYFAALFHSEMADSRRDELHVRGGLSARGFLIMLAVCRGEAVTLSDPGELWDAVECAAFLQAEALTRHLCDVVDSANCLALYSAARVFGVHELYHAAALFLCDAREDLWEDALGSGLPEELLEYSRSLSPASFVALGTHTPTTESLSGAFRVVLHLDEEGEGGWRHLTHLPALCSTSLAGVAVLHNRLYIVGGVRGYGKETVDGGHCYDPEADAWSPVPGPAQPRCDFTLMGHEGRLYAVGGMHRGTTSASAEAFDVATATWSPIRDAPRPVASAACAVARRRMFVCFWRPPDTTEIYEYAAAGDAWTPLTVLRRAQSYGHCMAAHAGALYVMRNGPGDDFLRCLMERYDLATGQWSSLPGVYVNSKGALFTARVRGDSAFTVKHLLTLVYRVTPEGRWTPRRQMRGYPESGSLLTGLLRLPRRRRGGFT